MLRIYFILIGLVAVFSVTAQQKLPQNYFIWPVKAKVGIAANFGELRPNHWHMGLDIRTDQRVNAQVLAAADGYIAKISVEPQGYGQAIYINHPNGLTTVYGHLNAFFTELDSFVKAKQYEKKSWEIDITFSPNQFPVKQGQFIAWSGNTGGSQGPHLHFEVRNTFTDRCINPFLAGLTLPDNVPPVITKLAMYDRNISTYLQTPKNIAIKKKNGVYGLIKDTLIKTGFSKLSFAAGTYDQLTGSSNPNGVYAASVWLDGELQGGFSIDSMDYDETEYIDAHIDYRQRFNGGSYLQHIAKLPGDHGQVYDKNKDGVVHLNDTAIHQVEIQISDFNKNTSYIRFYVQYNDSLAALIKPVTTKLFAPNMVSIFEQPDFEAYLTENNLYDSVPVIFTSNNIKKDNAISSLYTFGYNYIPVHGDFNVKMKPVVSLTDEQKTKIIVTRNDGKRNYFSKAKWINGWASSRVRGFGTFQALLDETPPTVNELGKGDTINLSSAKRIIFYPKDNSDIHSFNAWLDGEWLRFTNDKSDAWIYYFDEKCSYGVHNLKVQAEDIAGNVTTKEWWFKKYPYTPPPPKKKTKATKSKTKITTAKSVKTSSKNTKKKH